MVGIGKTTGGGGVLIPAIDMNILIEVGGIIEDKGCGQ